jgi:hypothetical protein
MNNRLAILIVFLLLLVIAAPAGATDRPLIAISKLAYELPIAGEGIADILGRELANSARFDVVGRPELERLLDDDGRAQSAYDKPALYLAAAKLLGADYLLTGRLTAFGENDVELGKGDWTDKAGLPALLEPKHVAYIRLDYRLIDTVTGEAVFADNVTGEERGKGISLGATTPAEIARLDFTSSIFRRAMLGKAAYKVAGGVLQELYGQFPLRATVLSRDGDLIVADLSVLAGVPKGGILTVQSMTPFSDSEGNVVWEYYQEVGTARVLSYKDLNCLAEIITGSAGISPNMVVMPVNEPRYYPPEFSTDHTRGTE